MTVAATITGVGRSAVAVIAVRGGDVAALVTECFRPATGGRFLPGRIRYGTWQGNRSACDAGESVVLTFHDSQAVEIHCHGGLAATRRIIEDLSSLGVVEITQHEFLVQTGSSPLIVEATEVLARCVTARTAAIALDQVRGALVDWTDHAIRRLADGGADIETLMPEVDDLLRFAPLTTRLSEPFRVVLVGPPNVGKSSLINAIVGYDRSITTDIAGTTRDVLHADTVIDGLPVRLSDTAGLRATDEAIEREGIARAREAAASADLVIHISEPKLNSTYQTIDSELLGSRSLQVLNKSDLLSQGDFLGSKFIRTNAISGDGVDSLLREISTVLVGSMPIPGSPVVLTQRQTEIVEQIAKLINDPIKMKQRLEELLFGYILQDEQPRD